MSCEVGHSLKSSVTISYLIYLEALIGSSKIHRTDNGIKKVHCLRVIHIYEANHNFLLGALWKNTLKKAEKEVILKEGLYGGRKGCCALDPVQWELLQYNI